MRIRPLAKLIMLFRFHAIRQNAKAHTHAATSLFAVLWMALLSPLAQGAEPVEENRLNLSLALGHGYAESPYQGADAFELHAIPTIAYYGQRWFFDNGTLGYALYETDALQLDLQVAPNLDGLYSNQAGGKRFLFLQRISVSSLLPDAPIDTITIERPVVVEERDLAWNGGLRLSYNLAGFDTWLEIDRDISGVYHGYEGQLGLRYHELFSTANFRLGVETGATPKSRDLIGYYYAPRPSELRPGLSDYEPHSTYNYYGQIDLDYRLTEHWSLTGFWRETHLGDSVRESPLSQKDVLKTWFLGLRVRL